MGTTDDSGVFSGGSGVEDPNAVHAKPEDIFPGLTDQLAKVPTNTLTPETIPSFFKVGAQTDNATALTGSTVASGYINVMQNREVGSFNCNKNYQTLSLGAPGTANT